VFEWMSVWVNECLSEWVFEWMSVWVNECLSEWVIYTCYCLLLKTESIKTS